MASRTSGDNKHQNWIMHCCQKIFLYIILPVCFKIIKCSCIPNLPELYLQLWRSHNYKSINASASVKRWRRSCGLHKEPHHRSTCSVWDKMPVCVWVHVDMHKNIRMRISHFIAGRFAVYQHLHGCEAGDGFCFTCIAAYVVLCTIALSWHCKADMLGAPWHQVLGFLSITVGKQFELLPSFCSFWS